MSRTAGVELQVPPEEALTVLRQATEAGGGGWIEDREEPALVIPVRAGLRRGFLRARPLAERVDGGTRLSLEIEEEALELDRAATMVLLFGALGGLLLLVWPLYPRLLGVAPVGAIAALAAWLLVTSRSRGFGPVDLLDMVAEATEDAQEEGQAGEE